VGLRIVSEKFNSSAGESNSADGYVDRLRKYIPSEAVTFWLTVSGMIQSAGDAIPKVGLLWLFFVIGLVFTVAWTRQRTIEPPKPTAWTQIGVSMGSFVVWVLATGGPLATSLPFYQPLYGSLLLITYTASVALIIPPEK
jgi:hypothetical protein